jgi:hypothetical protein
MRLADLSIPAFTLALAGCSAYAPLPDVSTFAHATLAGTHADVDADRVDTFRVVAIAGHDVLPITDQPAKLIGIDASHLVAAGISTHVEIEGLASYRNSVRSLFWDPMHVQGGVDFVPAAGTRYSLHGSITPDMSSVWIENDATHELVSAQISAAGRGAPPPADAASVVWPQMRSGGA